MIVFLPWVRMARSFDFINNPLIFFTILTSVFCLGLAKYRYFISLFEKDGLSFVLSNSTDVAGIRILFIGVFDSVFHL
jgi:hypothetical protein